MLNGTIQNSFPFLVFRGIRVKTQHFCMALIISSPFFTRQAEKIFSSNAIFLAQPSCYMIQLLHPDEL